MISLNLSLPRIDTGPFTFTSESRALPHRRSLNKKEKISLLEWQMRHRKELSPGKPFDLTSHAFLRALYEETAQKVVVCKSGQAGVSEYLVSYALHACDVRGLNVFHVFPTDGDISDFSAARIGPAIESSDYLSNIVVEARPAGAETKIRKRGADRVSLKRIRDHFWYLRGGQVKKNGNAPQLKSAAADVLIMDEWDEIDPRATELARKRLGASKVAEERFVSTPSYAGQGIYAAYMASDQRAWHIRCEHCGNRQALTIQDVVIEWDELERPVVWHGMKEDRAYCACRKCGKELNRLAMGEWVAAMPGAETVGYHISKLFAPLSQPIAIVRRLQSVNEDERKECLNQDLGLSFRPRGGGLDDTALDACRRDYGHTIGSVCYMGIDVGSVLHVVVRARRNPETGERKQLFAGETTWKQLPLLWRRHRPAITVIDGDPEGEKAREFQELSPKRIWLADYPPGGIDDISPLVKDDDKLIVKLDRTRSLDITFERFMEQENTLPANARDVTHYYEQMKAPVRVIEKNARGISVARYVENSADHFAHAENYCTAASMLTKPGVPLAQGKTKGWGTSG